MPTGNPTGPGLPATKAKPTGNAPNPAPVPVKGKPINKELQKELVKQQKALEKLEGQLTDIRTQMVDLEATLALPDTYNDLEKFKHAEKSYQDSANRLQILQAEYDALFEKMMETEEALNA